MFLLLITFVTLLVVASKMDHYDLHYGSHQDQYCQLFPPSNEINVSENVESRPIAILIHGGFWKQKYNVSNALLDRLTPFLQSNSFWVYLVEYRRGNDNDGGFGGWPNTNEDMVLAMNALHSFVNTNNAMLFANHKVSAKLGV